MLLIILGKIVTHYSKINTTLSDVSIEVLEEIIKPYSADNANVTISTENLDENMKIISKKNKLKIK